MNAQLPPPLSDIIVCAMAKDPANRFQNAQALSNALRQVAAMQDEPTRKEEAAYTPVPFSVPPSQPRNRLLPWSRLLSWHSLLQGTADSG